MKYTLSKKEISELTDIQLVKASPILFLTAQEQILKSYNRNK